MGLTAFHIVLCAALIGPRRIFREILESDYRHLGQTIGAHSGSGADVVYEDRFDDVFEGFQEASAVEVVEDPPPISMRTTGREDCAAGVRSHFRDQRAAHRIMGEGARPISRRAGRSNPDMSANAQVSSRTRS